MTACKPLAPGVAAARGLSPAARALAMTHAKAVAFHWVRAVRAGEAQQIQQIFNGLSEVEVAALAIVLAEVADPTRLKVVTSEADNGIPAHANGGAAQQKEG